MADILGLLSFHQDESKCINNVSKNPGLALLLVDGFSDLMVLHNVHCLPANVYRPVPEMVALRGDGVSADCYRIDPSSSFTDLEFSTPLWRDLKSVADEDSLKKLLPQEPSSSAFKGKQTMLVPPLVLVTILETKSLSPVVLIPALSAKFQEFDRASTTVKACTVLRPVLEFLWAVYQKKSTFLSSGIGPKSRRERLGRENALSQCHFSSLTVSSSYVCPSAPTFVDTSPGPIFLDSGRTAAITRRSREATSPRNNE